MVGAIPAQGDKAVLFNIRMPHQYVAGAYTELEQAALKAITELYDLITIITNVRPIPLPSIIHQFS